MSGIINVISVEKREELCKQKIEDCVFFKNNNDDNINSYTTEFIMFL